VRLFHSIERVQMNYTTAVALAGVFGILALVLAGLLLAMRAERDFYRADAELLARVAAGRDAEAAQFARRNLLPIPASVRDQPAGGAHAASAGVSSDADALVAQARRILAGMPHGATAAPATAPAPGPSRTG
jgi:hypothetical protein